MINPSYTRASGLGIAPGDAEPDGRAMLAGWQRPTSCCRHDAILAALDATHGYRYCYNRMSNTTMGSVVRTHTSTEVRRITGVTAMQINHWDRLGIVKPSVRAADGTGSRRMYALDDLLMVEVARQLRAVHLSLERLAAVVRTLRARWPRLALVSRETAVLIRPDGTCAPLPAGRDPVTALSTHRAGVILDLGGVVADLLARIGAAPRPAPAEPTPKPRQARPPHASAWGEDW